MGFLPSSNIYLLSGHEPPQNNTCCLQKTKKILLRFLQFYRILLFPQGPLGTRLRRPDYGSPPPRSRPTPSEGSFVPPGRPRPSSGGGFGEPVATIEKVDTLDQDQRRRRPFGRPGQGGSVQLEQTDHHDHHHHDHEGPEKERPARKDVEEDQKENGEKH